MFIDRSVKNVSRTIVEAVLLVALVIFIPPYVPSDHPHRHHSGEPDRHLCADGAGRLHHQHADAAGAGAGHRLVVDDAIVMLENIYRHIEGAGSRSAAIRARGRSVLP